LLLVGSDDDHQEVAECISLYKAKYRDGRTVVLGRDFDSEKLFNLIEIGVDGFLLKTEISPNALLKSLDLIFFEEVVLPKQFMELMREQLRRCRVASSSHNVLLVSDGVGPDSDKGDRQNIAELKKFKIQLLSSTEQVVLRYITGGAPNKIIARELRIAEATVKVHVKSILRKINVSNRTQAAMWAIRNGSIPFEQIGSQGGGMGA